VAFCLHVREFGVNEMIFRERLRGVGVGLIVSIAFVALSGCQNQVTEVIEVPESNYPEDERDGYQPGGGMMPTFVPTQDGYETIEPTE
tara:strand:+ start:139 stop:402 length:264 start_codon:yes stop_codon:yes gene_type:complete